FGDNLIRYYEQARKNDLYVSFAVTPPSGIRSREIFTGEGRDDPTLQVVAEGDDGVTISGMKMLATGAAFADEVWIGNLTPIDDKRASESITCALPINTPGVSFWAREPYERHARHEADYPLSFRFDETDTVLVCDLVKVPWERVFLHNNGAMSRRIYIETPANCYQNHQSNVRFWAKMGLMVGLASRMCQANGVDKIPAVRDTLGRLAALEATIGGLVNGQIEAYEQWPDGYATPNRRIMYATLNWCQEHHGEIIDALRTLAGAAPLQMPASIDLVADPELKDRFERWWGTSSAPLPSLPHRRARLAVLRQFVEHGFEILGLAEIAIDRGEAYIGDVVERAQRLHHHLAHGLGGDLALALALELAHDLGHGLIDALGLDRTLAQRDLHRAQQLVAVERHAAAVALDDHELAQLHALERCKAEIAGQAHPAAADDGGILGRPRVLDLRIEAAAIRTAHGSLPLPRSLSPAPIVMPAKAGIPSSQGPRFPAPVHT